MINDMRPLKVEQKKEKILGHIIVIEFLLCYINRAQKPVCALA